MACNLNGRWEVKQLFSNFQDIFRMYKDNLKEKSVLDILKLDVALTGSDDD